MTNDPAMTGAELALLCRAVFPNRVWKPGAAVALNYNRNHFYGLLSGRIPINERAAELIRAKLRKLSGT